MTSDSRRNELPDFSGGACSTQDALSSRSWERRLFFGAVFPTIAGCYPVFARSPGSFLCVFCRRPTRQGGRSELQGIETPDILQPAFSDTRIGARASGGKSQFRLRAGLRRMPERHRQQGKTGSGRHKKQARARVMTFERRQR